MLSLSGGFGSVIQALCTFSSLHPSVSAPLFFPPDTPVAAAAALMPAAAALPTLLAVMSDLYSVPASRCSCVSLLRSAWVTFFFFFCPLVQREILCQAE